MNQPGLSAARDLFYLCSCRIRGIPCDPDRLLRMNPAKMLRLARQHTLEALTCMAFEAAGLLDRLSPEEAAALKTSRDKAVRKVLLLDAGREELFRFFDEQKIWHMPLKGVILKDCYPALGMRQMCDNDILYDGAYQRTVRDFMESRGYTAVSVGKDHEDAYHKPPVYNYELHTRLFDPETVYAYDYYRNITERCKRQGYLYTMTDEDFYLYFLAHAYKHYSSGGIGLRYLVDCWAFLRAKGAALNRDYINRELDRLGLTAFEQESRSLSEKLMAVPGGELTRQEESLLGYYITSGTYGTVQRRAENQTAARMQRMDMDPAAPDKSRYLWRRLFPGEEYYRMYVPFCLRHRWARPFFGVYRMVRLGLDPERRRRLRQELHVLFRKKKRNT